MLVTTLQLLNYLQSLKPPGRFKELRNILRIFVFSHYFSGLSKSAFSTFYFEKLVFHRSAFYMFSICHEF